MTLSVRTRDFYYTTLTTEPMGHQAVGDGPGRIGRTPIHDGRRIQISVDRVRFPDGSEGDLDFIRHPGASAILPVIGQVSESDPEVLLLKQYRYAAGGFIVEVPAGCPDYEGEPWEVVASRELEEETGWRSKNLSPMTRIFTTPGFTDEVIHLFVASELEPGTSNLDQDEYLEVVRVPFSQAVEWVRDGTIVDCKSMATILYAAQFLIGRAEGQGD